MDTPEVWKSIADHPGYQISNHGRIIGPKGHVLKPWTHKSGHLYVRFRRIHRYQVHRLVLMNFCRLPEFGEECLHNDGNPTNNHIDNLRWGTRRENLADYIEKYGWSPRSSLTYDQADSIRSELDGKRGTQSRLARKYGVSVSCISRIALGRIYRHVCDYSA